VKVSEITPCEAFWVEFEGDETTYVRFGPGSWMYRVGEILEPEYDCAEHEAAYQAALLQRY
jgi:hypothetical protein